MIKGSCGSDARARAADRLVRHAHELWVARRHRRLQPERGV